MRTKQKLNLNCVIVYSKKLNLSLDIPLKIEYGKFLK